MSYRLAMVAGSTFTYGRMGRVDAIPKTFSSRFSDLAHSGRVRCSLEGSSQWVRPSQRRTDRTATRGRRNSASRSDIGRTEHLDVRQRAVIGGTTPTTPTATVMSDALSLRCLSQDRAKDPVSGADAADVRACIAIAALRRAVDLISVSEAPAVEVPTNASDLHRPPGIGSDTPQCASTDERYRPTQRKRRAANRASGHDPRHSDRDPNRSGPPNHWRPAVAYSPADARAVATRSPD
ncbi:hypothetical protein BKA25_001286 [Actinoalloteichus hymeniacidonis]|uniref:Uncharacterized protein n=1 Tax=Actinoalloteichus hymeniacidonis TaxID=340345 RepID=A0AAC9HUV2_9PSEU|nr:hypothetical protein TL08_20820 [Actinoalloteichus hymeniacidonis]MBB5906970.1 hypothetical protein [Actinoalloteichus hymeniacidonis]